MVPNVTLATLFAEINTVYADSGKIANVFDVETPGAYLDPDVD